MLKKNDIFYAKMLMELQRLISRNVSLSIENSKFSLVTQLYEMYMINKESCIKLWRF